MVSSTHGSATDTDHGQVIINLVEAMKPTWTGSGPYPGDPYDHNAFRRPYTDHHPISFRLAAASRRD